MTCKQLMGMADGDVFVIVRGRDDRSLVEFDSKCLFDGGRAYRHGSFVYDADRLDFPTDDDFTELVRAIDIRHKRELEYASRMYAKWKPSSKK